MNTHTHWSHHYFYAIAFLIITHTAFCQNYFTFYGTTNAVLGIVFEDASLSTGSQSNLVNDLNNCMQFWGKNSSLLLGGGDRPGVIGYLDRISQSPHYPETLDFPNELIPFNGKPALFIRKELSDAYTNAFVFAVEHSNIVHSAYQFVEFVASTNFLSVTPRQISNYVYYNQAPERAYELSFSDITNEIRTLTFYKPSLLGFHYSNTGPDAANNLWLNVPASYDVHGDGTVTNWFPHPALWHDGKWKFCAWEDNPQYRLPPEEN